MTGSSAGDGSLTGGVGGVRRVLALLRGPQGGLHGVDVGLFLELADVLLVTDPLVAKPVGHLSAGSGIPIERGQR